MTEPDFAAALATHLETQELGRAHLHFQELDSTNDHALAMLRAEPAPVHGQLVTATRQRAGRGRMGRSWDSSGADIYASIILRPGATAHPIGALALAAGLGLAEGLARVQPWLELALKWPNDLLWVGAQPPRKIGGILCETRWVGPTPEIVVGFGLNLGRLEFEAEIAEHATSVALAHAHIPWVGGAPELELDRARVLADLLGGLEPRMRAFFSGGFPCIREAYLARCDSIGAEVWTPRVQPDGQTKQIRARIEGLDLDGALRVRSLGGGPSFRVQSADVWLQGPGDDTQGAC